MLLFCVFFGTGKFEYMKNIYQDANNRWILAFYICSFLILFLLYRQTLDFGYVWDDNELFVYNPALLNNALSWDLLARPVLEDTSYFRPLVFLSWFVEFRWFGLNPSVSHAINISAFYLSVILLFHLLRHIFKDRKHVNEVSSLAALIYLCHPMNVEAVAWVAGRFDIFATFFLLLAFYAFLVISNNILRITLVSIAYLAALGSKEIGILFIPAVFCLWVLIYHHDGTPWKMILKQFFQKNISLLGFIIILTIMYLLVRRYYASGITHKAFTWSYVKAYYLTDQIPIVSLKEYIWRTIFPFYDLGPFLPNEYFARLPNIIISWFVVGLLLFTTFWALHNKKTWIFALFGYVIMISLVIYIIPITIANNIVQDRFLLSALPFYVILLSCGMFYLIGYGKKTYAIYALAMIYAFLLSLITLQLVPMWHDELKFWHHASAYQEKYTKEPLPMYLRSLMIYDAPEDMIESIVNKQRESIKKTGEFRPIFFILYGQYLVIKKKDPKGLDYMREYMDYVTELWDKKIMHDLNKSNLFSIYHAYALGELTIEHDINKAEEINKKAQRFSPYESSMSLSLDVMLDLLQNRQQEAKNKFNRLMNIKNLDKKEFVENMNNIVKENCEKNNLDIPACQHDFDIQQLSNE